jgi:hypothetical protein
MGMVTVVVDDYWRRPTPLQVSSRAANVARRLRSSTYAKLYVYETLLQRLAQDLQDMAAALGPFIPAEHAMVGPRHVARPRHVAPPISPASEMG